MSHFFLNACSDVARKTAWVVLLMHAKNAADRNDPISCFLHTELRRSEQALKARSDVLRKTHQPGLFSSLNFLVSPGLIFWVKNPVLNSYFTSPRGVMARRVVNPIDAPRRKSQFKYQFLTLMLTVPTYEIFREKKATNSFPVLIISSMICGHLV